MNSAKAILGVLCLVVAFGSTGCAALGLVTMPMTKGANLVFEKSFFCPSAQITVTARPDIPPHTLFGPQSDAADSKPPPDVAADPARLQIWQQQMAQKQAGVDSLGPIYEVGGCGKKVMLLCFHPTEDDIAANNGVVVGDTGILQGNDGFRTERFVSAVACASEQSPNNGEVGLRFDALAGVDFNVKVH